MVMASLETKKNADSTIVFGASLFVFVIIL